MCSSPLLSFSAASAGVVKLNVFPLLPNGWLFSFVIPSLPISHLISSEICVFRLASGKSEKELVDELRSKAAAMFVPLHCSESLSREHLHQERVGA